MRRRGAPQAHHTSPEHIVHSNIQQLALVRAYLCARRLVVSAISTTRERCLSQLSGARADKHARVARARPRNRENQGGKGPPASETHAPGTLAWRWACLCDLAVGGDRVASVDRPVLHSQCRQCHHDLDGGEGCRAKDANHGNSDKRHVWEQGCHKLSCSFACEPENDNHYDNPPNNIKECNGGQC